MVYIFVVKSPKIPVLHQHYLVFTPLCAYDYVIPNIFWEPEAIFDVMCGYGDCCKLCTSYQSSKQTWFNSKFIAHFWSEKLNFLSDILKNFNYYTFKVVHFFVFQNFYTIKFFQLLLKDLAINLVLARLKHLSLTTLLKLYTEIITFL